MYLNISRCIIFLHLPVWQECLDALLGLRGGAGSAQLDVLRAVKEQQATVYEFVIKPFRSVRL